MEQVLVELSDKSKLLHKLKAAYSYPAALDVVEFLLKTLFDTGGFLECDENESPPLFCFVVRGKLSSFNLEGMLDYKAV